MKYLYNILLIGTLFIFSCDKGVEDPSPLITSELEIIDLHYEIFDYEKAKIDVFGHSQNKINGTDISVSFTKPKNGDLIKVENESYFEYTPEQNFYKIIPFTYTVTVDGKSKTRNISVEVLEEKCPHGNIKATDDILDMYKIGTFEIDIEKNILGNDIICNCEMDVINIPNESNSGIKLTKSNNKILFQPMSTSFLEDFFTYEIVDKCGERSSATVTIKFKDRTQLEIK